jgi:trans-aconitate 2-methyltransferase
MDGGTTSSVTRRYEQWERMQDNYVPRRRFRFDLILRFVGLPAQADLAILDLGSGPGSLAFHALAHHPRARVMAVDRDPVLLALGQKVAQNKGVHVQFARMDLRDPTWWNEHGEKFDLVVSATALHWLSQGDLVETLEHVRDVLKPGGWFFNSDQMAAENPETQARNRAELSVVRQAAFRAVEAPDWDLFWSEIEKDPAFAEARAMREEAGPWEGNEDGESVEFHLSQLRGIGFESAHCLWRYLGEAIVAARRPQATPRGP